MVCSDTQGGLFLWDWHKGQEQLLKGEGPVASGLRFHQQTQLLVVTYPIHPFWELWTFPKDGRYPTSAHTLSLFPPSAVRTFALHPTENWLATAHTDGQIRLWQL